MPLLKTDTKTLSLSVSSEFNPTTKENMGANMGVSGSVICGCESISLLGAYHGYQCQSSCVGEAREGGKGGGKGLGSNSLKV